jgi:hypothetical protein
MSRAISFDKLGQPDDLAQYAVATAERNAHWLAIRQGHFPCELDHRMGAFYARAFRVLEL